MMLPFDTTLLRYPPDKLRPQSPQARQAQANAGTEHKPKRSVQRTEFRTRWALFSWRASSP